MQLFGSITTTSFSFIGAINRARCLTARSAGVGRLEWSSIFPSRPETTAPVSIPDRPSWTSYWSARCVARVFWDGPFDTVTRYSEKNASCHWPTLIYVTLSSQRHGTFKSPNNRENRCRNYVCLSLRFTSPSLSPTDFAPRRVFFTARCYA